MAALYSQWSTEDLSNPMGSVQTSSGCWPQLPAGWGPAGAQLQPVYQGRMLAQRAASAPAPFDLDWAALL